MIPLPVSDEFPTEQEQRMLNVRRLHEIIRKLVKWENTDESKPVVRELLAKARYEIARSDSAFSRRRGTQLIRLKCWTIYV